MDREDNPGVRAAIEIMGGQRKLAEALGMSQPQVCDWLHGRYRVPAAKAYLMEQLTGVPKELIRPDVFGPRVATTGKRRRKIVTEEK